MKRVISFAIVLLVSLSGVAQLNHSATILTPPPGKAPRITGAKIFGVRPGSPVLYKISATGQKPLKYTVKNLPKELQIDEKTGLITGKLTKTGSYKFKVQVANSIKKVHRIMVIKVGDLIALTPPMGWNSWSCWGLSVSQERVKSSAQAMIDKGLIDHGWSYVNIDDGWEAAKRSAGGAIRANEKFPDMKGLADWLHNKGLKFGIYSSPGPRTCGGYLGSYQHEMQDAATYADWGVDYLKYDFCSYWDIYNQSRDTSLARRIKPYEEEANYVAGSLKWGGDYVKSDFTDYWEIFDEEKAVSLAIIKKPFEIMHEAMQSEPRDIYYSLGIMVRNVWDWGSQVGGNSWRVMDDILDAWDENTGAKEDTRGVKNIGFSVAKVAKYSRPGSWNDPDQLMVGNVGWGDQLYPTKLSPDEQYSQVSLWCLLSAPLLIGCDVASMDDFTVSLLSNDEVLALDQDPLGKSAERIIATDTYQVWVKQLEDGSRAVGIFNFANSEQTISVKWSDLKIKGGAVRDLWRQKDLGVYKKDFITPVPSHGVRLIKVK